MSKKLKGARTKVKKNITIAEAAIQKIKEDPVERFEMVKAQAAEMLTQASITMSEGRLMQNIFRDAKVPVETRRAEVQEELDLVHDAKDLESSMLLPSLYAEALRFLRT